MRLLIFFFLVVSALAFSESPFKELSGFYYISSAPHPDPEEALPDNTHLYLNLSGEAAQKAYEAIQAKPVKNYCGEDHFEKIVGNFSCAYYPDSKKYECYFSVNITNGEIELGGFC